MKISKIITRGLSLILSAAMFASLAACSNKDGDKADTVKNLYKAEDLVLPEGVENVIKVANIKDSLYVYGTESESTGEGENASYKYTGNLYILDMTGKLVNTVKLTESVSDAVGNSTSQDISCLDFDSEGNMWCFFNENTYTAQSEEDMSAVSSVMLSGNTTVTYMKKYDTTGKELYSKDISEYTKDQDVYFNNFVVGADNNVYACANSSVWVFDSNGGLLFKTESADSENTWINSIVRAGDGKVYVLINEYSNDVSKSTLKQIDPVAKGYGTVYEMTSNNNTVYNGSSDYDIYMNNNGTLLGYDLETAKETEIVNWVTCGVNPDNMQGMSILSDGKIVSYGYNYSGMGSSNGMTLTILRKLQESEIKEKKVITLYCWYIDYSLKQSLVEFNKTSEDYIVAVTDYSQYNKDYTGKDGDTGYMAGATKLNNDLIAGKIPDILMLDGSVLTVKNYAAKGLLEDLDPYLEKDPDLKRDDFVESVLKLSEVDGKLYSMMSYFNISTLYGKKENVGDQPGWTFDDLYAAMDKLPEGAKIMNNSTKKDMLSTFTYMNQGNLINWNTGECKFNSDEFIKLLEFANQFEDKIDDENVDWEAQSQDMSKNKVLLEMTGISNFKDMKQLAARAGGDITYIGFPNSNGTNGACLSGTSEMAISSKSKNKEGAWQVIKYLLPTVKSVENNNYYGFPILKAPLEKMKQLAMEPDFYLDENGKKVVYENSTYNINGVDVKITPCDQADIDKIMSIIDNTKVMLRYDESINKIIEEESAAFFSGQKTSKEVAEIIQNRVSIYINESR